MVVPVLLFPWRFAVYCGRIPAFIQDANNIYQALDVAAVVKRVIQVLQVGACARTRARVDAGHAQGGWVIRHLAGQSVDTTVVAGGCIRQKGGAACDQGRA